MGLIALENDELRAEFDEANGALVGLHSKRTGWRIHRRAELGQSFRMYVPLPERRNNQVLGIRQSRPVVEHDADNRRITFTWEKLDSEHGGRLDIRFTAAARLTEEGLSFTGEISNDSPHVVEAVCWPVLADLSSPSESQSLTRMNISYAAGRRAGLWPSFSNECGYFGTDYPIQMARTPEAPFVLVDAEGQGLYAGYHDETCKQLVSFTFELKPGYQSWGGVGPGRAPAAEETTDEPVRVEFYPVHFAYARGGEETEIGPVILRPYQGTWHSGADYYRHWRQEHLPDASIPDWARRVHSWQQIHVNSPEDELRCPYRELLRYGRDCAEHGVAAIQLTGWTVGGQDRGNPSHDVEPRLGTAAELKEAVRAIQAMGVKVVVFTKFTWADRAEPWFRGELADLAARDPYGDYHVYRGYQYQTPAQLSDIGTRRLVPMCPHSPRWREIAVNEFRKGIELGADGMLYDECQHHGGMRYCFHDGHGHAVPAHLYAGDVPLAECFRTAAQHAGRDGYLFAGEACWDAQTQQYALSYFRIGAGHIPMHRYVNPRVQMMVAVCGYDDRETINQCLKFRYVISYEPRNFKGRLSEFPATVAYGRKMDELRRRYAPWLWEGDFHDTVGARVLVDGQPYGDYSVFRRRDDGRRAVVVCNADADREIYADVAADGGPLRHVVTPEDPDPSAFEETVRIPPRSACVLLQRLGLDDDSADV